MALVSSTLQASFLATFLAMDSMTKDGNKYMADNVAKNIKDYILTRQTVTADNGAAPAGSYVGAGTGTMTINDSALASDLKNTFEAKYSNDDLASHMANDIDKACSAENTVEETSKGTVTASSGSTSGFSGPVKGKFSGNKATIESGLKSCFKSMDSMTKGGNEYFAAEFAMAVDLYLKAGTISVNLKQPFVSGSGTGKIA